MELKKLMTFEEFLRESRSELANFEAMWRKKNKENPEQWPMEMWSGDWWEQMEMWSGDWWEQK